MVYSANLYLLLAVGNDFYCILRTSKYRSKYNVEYLCLDHWCDNLEDKLRRKCVVSRVVQSRIMQYSRIDISNLEFRILF